MSKEDLMKERYIVEALWLNHPEKIKVGDVLKFDELNNDFYCNGERFVKHAIARYPNLFRKLEWYEERAIEDMPEYVKTKDGKVVKKVHCYAEHWVFFTEQKHRNLNNYLPATLEEYNLYLQTKQQ